MFEINSAQDINFGNLGKVYNVCRNFLTHQTDASVGQDNNGTFLCMLSQKKMMSVKLIQTVGTTKSVINQ